MDVLVLDEQLIIYLYRTLDHDQKREVQACLKSGDMPRFFALLREYLQPSLELAHQSA